jgi:hypothetical protein
MGAYGRPARFGQVEIIAPDLARSPPLLPEVTHAGRPAFSKADIAKNDRYRQHSGLNVCVDRDDCAV